MKRTVLNGAAWCLATSLAGASFAWAQEPPHGEDHRAEQHAPAHAEPARPGGAPHEAAPAHARPAAGPAGHGNWHSGARFTGSRVSFSDWGRYHLNPPPPGFEWVQDGNELVLINLSTGLISDTFFIP
jgi:Ni/Co efflux regulator RcnB